MTKVCPFLTTRYIILCTRRLQAPRDDCADRVQWFSSENKSIYFPYYSQSVKVYFSHSTVVQTPVILEAGKLSS